MTKSALPVMTDAERMPIANRFQEEMRDLVVRLFGRWQDEKEYEDIADYRKVLTDAAKRFPQVEITKMTSRPFGFFFELGGCTYQIKVTASTYAWKRVK